MYLTFPPFPVRNSTLRAQPGLWQVSEALHLCTPGEGKWTLGTAIPLLNYSRSMYFDEDGDLAHEFYEEVLPRYKNVMLQLSINCLTDILLGGKVAREKCAKLRRISGSSLDNHFVHIIRSRPQKMNKGDQLYSPSGHRGRLNTVCHDCT